MPAERARRIRFSRRLSVSFGELLQFVWADNGLGTGAAGWAGEGLTINNIIWINHLVHCLEIQLNLANLTSEGSTVHISESSGAISVATLLAG